jgi:hypothetical protein
VLESDIDVEGKKYTIKFARKNMKLSTGNRNGKTEILVEYSPLRPRGSNDDPFKHCQPALVPQSEKEKSIEKRNETN